MNWPLFAQHIIESVFLRGLSGIELVIFPSLNGDSSTLCNVIT
jgi:hypothetical protein